MENRQQRARDQFPQVLLAVLGIIQALALELLWERGVPGIERWRAVDAEVAGLLQALAVFLGIIVMWVVFATMLLRFRWQPRFHDLVLPFLLGGLEFMLVECMAPEQLVRWFALLAFIFVAVSATTFVTFHHVLLQEDDQERPTQEPVSYLPSVVVVVLLLASAIAVWRQGPSSATATIVLALANLGLLAQLWVVRFFWYRDLREA